VNTSRIPEFFITVTNDVIVISSFQPSIIFFHSSFCDYNFLKKILNETYSLAQWLGRLGYSRLVVISMAREVKTSVVIEGYVVQIDIVQVCKLNKMIRIRIVIIS
jgi:hypothetical protein